MIKIGITTGLARETYRQMITLNRFYVRVLERTGVLPVLIPNMLDPATAKDYVASIDGLLLSGGADVASDAFGQGPVKGVAVFDRNRDAMEWALAKEAISAGMPILGICRGMQLLNIVAGGDLIQDIPSYDPHAYNHVSTATLEEGFHLITVEEGSWLYEAIGHKTSFLVNSEHHQAVGRLGEGYRAVAHSADGIVEAMEHESLPIYGVQFHPEAMAPHDDSHFGIFQALVRELKVRSQA